MTASTLSPRTEMVFQRHVPPTQAPVLKNPASELMTRLAFIAQPSAEPQRSTTHRDARKIWETVKPLQSAVKPETTATPAKRPGHKVAWSRVPRLAMVRQRNGCFGDADGSLAG